MLPQAVFDQIVKTSGIRSDQGGKERRSAIRVPVKGLAEARGISVDRARQAIHVRLRDISLTGVAVLLQERQMLSREFIIRIALGEGRTVAMLCQTRRATTHDGCKVISAMFLRMMLPGQVITDNTPVNQIQWYLLRTPVVPVGDSAVTPASEASGPQSAAA